MLFFPHAHGCISRQRTVLSFEDYRAAIVVLRVGRRTARQLSRLVMFDLFCEIFMVHGGDANEVGNLEEFTSMIRLGRTQYTF